MLPAPVSGIRNCQGELEAIKKMRWSGVHDLDSITKKNSLPILVRALESHYGNSDLNAFSRLDVLKIHNAVVVDLVLAKFERTGKASKREDDFIVDLVDDKPVQICLPKDFCGLFQLAHSVDKVKRYKSAKELAHHLPRLVKVISCGREFPPDISKGDIIQVIMEVDDGIKPYLRVKRNKVGAEPTEMSLKCKGVFESVIDCKSYSLSELLQLFTLPCKVSLPKKSKRTLSVKSEVLSLFNHVGGTLTLQREVASEFYVATTTAQQSANQTTILVLSKNANVQFEIAEERDTEDYQKVLESFGTVAIKGIPQELFISEHGMPFVACLNYRKHTQPAVSAPTDTPPTPPPRPRITMLESRTESHTPSRRETRRVNDYTNTELQTNITRNMPFADRKGITAIPDDTAESLYESIVRNSPRKTTRLESTYSPQCVPTDNDDYAEIKQRNPVCKEVFGHATPIQKPSQVHTLPYERRNRQQTTSFDSERRSQLYRSTSSSAKLGQIHTKQNMPNDRPDLAYTVSKRRHEQSLILPSERQHVLKTSLRLDKKPTSMNTSTTTCDSISNTTQVTPVPPITITMSQEDPYVNMRGVAKHPDKNFQHPEHASFPHSIDESLPIMRKSGSCGEMIDKMMHHRNFPTISSGFITKGQRSQDRPESPLRDCYIKMEREHFTCEKKPVFGKTQLQDEYHTNSPAWHFPNMRGSGSEMTMMTAQTRKYRSNSLDDILRSPSRQQAPVLPPRPHLLQDRPAVPPPDHFYPNTIPRKHSRINDHGEPQTQNCAHPPSILQDIPVVHPPGHFDPYTIPGKHSRINDHGQSQTQNCAHPPSILQDRPAVHPPGNFDPYTIPRNHSRINDHGQSPTQNCAHPPTITNDGFVDYVTMPRYPNPSSNGLSGQRRVSPPVPKRDGVKQYCGTSQESQRSKQQTDKDSNSPEPSGHQSDESNLQEKDRLTAKDLPSPVAGHDIKIDQPTDETPVKPTIFRSKRQIPRDIGSLSVSELAQCLHLLNVDSKVINLLYTQQVDGFLMTHMSEDMLRNDLGVSHFQAKKLYLFAHDGWRPESTNENEYTLE